MQIKLTPEEIEKLVAEKEAELNKAAVRERFNDQLQTLIKTIYAAGFYVHSRDDCSHHEVEYHNRFRVR